MTEPRRTGHQGQTPRRVTGAAEPPRRRQLRGTDEFTTIGDVSFSHWDLWFAIVLAQRFDGSFDDLRGALIELPSSPWSSSRAYLEQLLSHLDDLRGRLELAGAGATELVARCDLTTYLENKARTKVLGDKHGLRDVGDPTSAMSDTPRTRMQRRARRGRWTWFPVSPEPYDVAFRSCGRSRDGYTKRQSFDVARRLEKRLETLGSKASRRGPAEQLACHRGFLAGFLDVMDRTDDSFGEMGRLCIDVGLPAYLEADWRGAGIAPEHYYRDFVEYAIWEDYALVDNGWRDGRSSVDCFCRAVPEAEFALVDDVACTVIAELEDLYGVGFDMSYQVVDAIEYRVALAISHRRHDRYAQLAALLGSDHWIPIERLATSALGDGRRDVAASVFAAADVPGMQRDTLARMCRDLLR